MRYYTVYKEVCDVPSGRVRMRVLMGTFREDAIVQLSEALNCEHTTAASLLGDEGGEVVLEETAPPFRKWVVAYSRCVAVPPAYRGRSVIYCAFDAI